MRSGVTVRFLALACLILLLAGIATAEVTVQTVYVDTSGIDACDVKRLIECYSMGGNT